MIQVKNMPCDNREPVKILLVDDEANVLKALTRLFFDEEYTVLTAASGEEGLAMLEKEYAQIIISDYRMPSMTGVEFLKEVLNRWPETIRIVLSGYADTAAIISAVNEGQIYKFIPKPWNDENLKTAIADAVERYFLCKRNSELARQLERKNEELDRVNMELKKLLEKEKADLRFQRKVLLNQQHILDMLPVGMIGIDSAERVVMCNACFADLLGNSKVSLDSEITSILPPKAIAAVAEAKTGNSVLIRCVLFGIPVKLYVIPVDRQSAQKGTLLLFVREDDIP